MDRLRAGLPGGRQGWPPLVISTLNFKEQLHQRDRAIERIPVRGTPGGWLEPWEWADRLDEARWRARAEAEERHVLAVLAAEREASAS